MHQIIISFGLPVAGPHHNLAKYVPTQWTRALLDVFLFLKKELGYDIENSLASICSNVFWDMEMHVPTMQGKDLLSKIRSYCDFADACTHDRSIVRRTLIPRSWTCFHAFEAIQVRISMHALRAVLNFVGRHACRGACLCRQDSRTDVTDHPGVQGHACLSRCS